MDVDEALRILFKESQTDMVMAQTVPVTDYWSDGLFPLSLNYKLKQACPERVLFCGGVDLTGMTLPAALREIERQVKDLEATSFKFYQTNSLGHTWAADDREIAYPVYEKLLSLGITNCQFHKGAVFGTGILNPAFQVLDLQKPARDFPEMTFVAHHFADPYVDETLSVIARFPNMMLSISGWINSYPHMPGECIHRLGKALRDIGPDRIMYGSEAFILLSVQTYLELFDSIEIPEELQHFYGYPALTREAKEKMLGLNMARMMGVDIEKKKQELYGDAKAGAVA
jgi:predicted TIM-barrel fold metal-dependent hydrolase